MDNYILFVSICIGKSIRVYRITIYFSGAHCYVCTFSFCCVSFQNESQIFPPTTGGGEKLSADSTIPLLGKLPLDPRIGEKNRKMFLNNSIFPTFQKHYCIIGIKHNFLCIYNCWALRVVLFNLILYVPSTIFQLYRDWSSWVEPVLS